MSIRRVALLTAGGFAPCLSAAVGDLIERYTEVASDVEIITYQYGYHGLLTGNYVVVDEEGRKNAGILCDFGSSPIGNSRVKLINAKNLVERGLVAEGVNPLEFAGYEPDLVGAEWVCRELIAAVGNRVAAFKPQSAFFEAFGSAGVAVLARVLTEIAAAGALAILDVKRGDIGSTMAGYTHADRRAHV